MALQVPILEAGDYYFATGNGAYDAVQAVLKEQYPDKMKDAEPTGTVYKEAVDSKLTLTESNGATIQKPAYRWRSEFL